MFLILGLSFLLDLNFKIYTMQEDIQYTKEDIQKAFDLHYSKQFPIRSKMLLLLGLILLVTAIFFFFSPPAKFPALKWLFTLMGFFYIGFYFYRKRTMVNLAMKNPTIKDMRKIKLTEEHIRFEGEKGYSEQLWGNFKEFYHNEDALLIYLSKHNFFILPKRSLSEKSLHFALEKLKANNA